MYKWSEDSHSWWRHEMETFSALLAFCEGHPPISGGFPSQNPATRSFDVFFDLHLNNGSANNRDSGDLRCHRAHYGVIVMVYCILFWIHWNLSVIPLLVCDLNRTSIVMAKHGGSCVHLSGISTCGRTSRETVSHPQCPPLPTLCKISLPIYVIVTNKLLQPLTTTWYDSLGLSFSLLKM